MPHRDPETGQFLPDSGGMDQFDDIEMVTFSANVGVAAADLTGTTDFDGESPVAFSGVQLIDYDDIVDRNEELHLMQAHHNLTVYSNSTQTADGTVIASTEVSADPALTGVTARASKGNTQALSPSGTTAQGAGAQDDSIDLIGPTLTAVGHAPFSDGPSGVGGGGSAGEAQYESTSFPAEAGRFHPRDELFANGQFVAWNISDSAIHLTLTGQHVYGVIEGV